MSTCKHCGQRIQWETGPNGSRPVDPDGTPHHRTCRKFHRLKKEEARRRREIKAAYGPAVAAASEIPENPNQMHFAF